MRLKKGIPNLREIQSLELEHYCLYLMELYKVQRLCHTLQKLNMDVSTVVYKIISIPSIIVPT